MDEERQRFYARLATLPGIQPMPSIGGWILLNVDNPGELARKINRRLHPGAMSVPRNVDGAVRVPVKDPKQNEALFHTLRELVMAKAATSAQEESVLHQPAETA